MPLNIKFDDTKLVKIKNQAIIYQCACPAQVVDSLFSSRELWRYQDKCENTSNTDVKVHKRIKQSIEQIHAELEKCLEDVLIMEEWDMESLKMPQTLKKRMYNIIDEE